MPDNIISAMRQDEDIMQNIHNVLHALVTSQQFPQQIFTGRLMVLNKNPGETPNLDALRPINITSVFLKILETICLNRMTAPVVNSIGKNVRRFAGIDLN